MKRILQTAMPWCTVLVLCIVIGVAAIPQSAFAAATINSATVNGGSTVTVGPGDSITAAVNATAGSANADKWKGTGWLISTTPPGSVTCQNTPDHTSETATETFSITAPLTAGTYNAYFRTYSDNGCANDASTVKTLAGGVVVQTRDLTATKSNNLGGGNALLNVPFTWKIRVENTGAATATFSNNDELLSDEMDDAGVSAYGAPVLTTSGTTGTIVCSQTGTDNRDLKCKASGTVTMPGGSYFDVSVAVTPTSIGGLVNPRSGKTCAADPGNKVTETNESNNGCSDSVTVINPATIVIVKDALPNDAQDFAFTSNIAGNTAFSLDDDADGTLSNTKTITGVAPGTYGVTEGSVSGWTLTGLNCSDPDQGSSVNVETGVATIDADAGETITCTYTNTKHASITIEKQTLPDGDQTAFTFTGNVAGTLSDGESATASDLMPGSYTGTETVPAGWDLTSISCSDNDSTGSLETKTATFRVSAGEDVTCTFTNTKRGKIHVTKIADPLGYTFGFTVQEPNQGPTHQQDLIVNSSGGASYTFDDLPSGSGYSISESVPQGWSGQQQSSCLIGQTPIPNLNDFTLGPGEEVYCTFNNTEYAVISGKKFEDSNADGVVGGAEEGLGGWNINLYKNNDGWSYLGSETTSGESGAYSFSSLLPGAYKVCEEKKDSKWHQSYPGAGASCTGEGEMPYGYEMTVGAGETHAGTDFGNYKDGSLEGKKFEDADADGLEDHHEGGLSGWTIYVDLNENGALDEGEPYDITAHDGKYKIENLRPGTYTVREVGQTGWTQTAPNGDVYHVTVLSNKKIKDLDFGNYHAGLISGVKWNDLDKDGVRDENEPGIDGWTIYATKGQTVMSTTTANGGQYSFTFGPPDTGIWTITEENRNGWMRTSENSSYVIEVSSGTESTNRNFGNWQYPVITGYKWNDEDGDGEWDTGEPAIEGWAVALGKRGTPEGEEQPIPIEIVALSLTGSDGAFSLMATSTGNYEVFEESQSGWTPTHPEARDSFFDITYHVDMGGRTLNRDSFFDVFADMAAPSGTVITEDTREHALRFGNHHTQESRPQSAPETIPPAGNGPIVGPNGIGFQGQVLGASIGPEGEVLGAATCDEPLLTQYLGPGRPGNNPAQVTLLQNFLNGEVSAGLPVTGYYGSLTTAAVRVFQLKYWSEVLAPWVPFGLPTDHTTTGFVGKLTLWKINSLICPGLNIPVPPLP